MNAWVAIVTVASLLFYFATIMAVARARKAYDVPAPAMSGDPRFERAMRVQVNTLEWLPIYLPALWLFALYVHPLWAAGFGVLWIVGRVIYMNAYLKDAAKRGPGFGIQALAAFILLTGGLIGAAFSLARVGG